MKKDRLLASRLIQDGVIRNLEVIGEATKNLSSELRDTNPAIPWRQIAAHRDHGSPPASRQHDEWLSSVMGGRPS